VGKTIAKAMAAQQGVDTTQIASIVAAVMAALNPTQTAAVAAVAVEQDMLEEELPEEELPQPVIPRPAFDIDGATRQEMMVFARTMGFKTLPFSAKAEDWREYLREQLALAQ
jgi:hypothetical protein